MITNWLERRRLVRKGLACDKTRLSHPDDSFRDRMDCSRVLRLIILGVFIILLHLGVAWGKAGSATEDQTLAFIVFISGLMLLELDSPECWRSNSRLVLILGVAWLNLFLVKLIYLVWNALNQGADTWYHFLTPYTYACAFAPFLITLLLGTRLGLYTVVQVSMLAALLTDRSFSFLLVSLLSGFTAVYFTQNVRKRFDLIKAGMAVGCLNLLCALVLGLVHGRHWDYLGEQALLGIGAGIFTALVVSAILPVVEWMAQITTTISWIELADLNHPLLQQMTMEAPGTYHHSLLVANLSESGAKAIGLDATACRVMAYFHDIGKIIKPEYFTENIPPGANPHENLTPSMSALIIIAHVKEGIDLALKYGLKKQVLDAIQQHHGDSVVSYFYQRALQQQRDAREGGKIMNMREEDVPEVSENSFRYPGPKPQTKEIGLLSIADAVEAASRSLEKPTAQRIEDLVNEIVAHKISTHQLDECHLTMNEIRTAAEAMSVTLKNMMHTRISYNKKSVPMRVRLSNQQSEIPIRVRPLLRQLKASLSLLPAPLPADINAIEIVLVDRATMAGVHGDFLDDKTETDVITFPYGEILVCPAVAKEQASRHGLGTDHEILLYALHGILHLVGYDDTTPAKARKMSEAQEKLLKRVLKASK